MKAQPQAQRRLLDLQAIDTALAQLNHRVRTLPEMAELDRLARSLSTLEDQRVRAQTVIDDLDRDISRYEKDVEQVRARAERNQARLDAGTGPARELEALQHELATLERRKADLEESELALLEQREGAVAEMDQIVASLVELRRTRAETEARRDTTLKDLDKEVKWRSGSRAPIVADLPADLISRYEKLREATGIGAALLRAGRCGGCRIELAGSELARVRSAPSDEVVICEECRRILVRTEESGL